jgi:hypothetical protein
MAALVAALNVADVPAPSKRLLTTLLEPAPRPAIPDARIAGPGRISMSAVNFPSKLSPEIYRSLPRLNLSA